MDVVPELVFVDTEFIEDGSTIELISLGAVRADGSEFYAEAAWTDLSRANEWVRANVIPHLEGGTTLRTNAQMRREFVDFCGAEPQFWAWFGAYDWVVICQLFGRMVDLPSHWPMRVNDVAQLAQMVGANKLPRQNTTEHHALADARWTRYIFRWLRGLYRERLEGLTL